MATKINIVGWFLVFMMGCGGSASSPSSPAQIPTSIEYATIEISVGATGVSENIIVDSEKAIDGEIEEDVTKSVVGTCPSTSDDPSWVCINPAAYIVGIVKMELGKCVDSNGIDTTCTFSMNSHQNVVVTNADGTDPTWVTVWDAETTTTSVIGDSTLKEYSLELTSGTGSLPGTEHMTTFGSFSAFRFKVGYVAYQLPDDAILGSLRNTNFETCTATGGCVSGSSLIAAGARGDVIKTDSSAYYWYDNTLDTWVTSRPSDPKIQSQYIEGDSDYDPYFYDSEGVFTAYLKIDNNSDGTADAVTIESGKTYTLTLLANVSNSFQFKDTDDDDVYDDSEDISDNAPVLGLTAAEKTQ